MKSFKQLMDEAHYVATADFKVSASGRKVHKMKKIADDPEDLEKDDESDDDKKMTKESTELVEYETKDGVYRHQAKAGRYGGSEKERHAVDTMAGPKKSDLEKIETDKKKKVKEETELEEAVTVKKQDYSWGKMVTVHHGSDTSYPLHPEHQKKIAGLKHGEKTSFKDETGSTVHAEREDDKVHLSSKNTNKKTTVAHSHFTESVNKSDVPAFLRKKNGDKLTLKDLDKERTQNRSHPETLKKINGTDVKEAIETTHEYHLRQAAMYKKKGDERNAKYHHDRAHEWHIKAAHDDTKRAEAELDRKYRREETAPVAPVPDRKYIKGTPEWKANKEKNKPRTGQPTNEAVDKEEQRFLMLARLGLVDKSEVSKLRIAMDQLKADKPLTVAQRSMLLSVMSDLVSLVTGDDMIFNRVKRDIQTEDYTLVEEEEIVLEGDNKQMKDKDPCWKGYQMVGMKDKNGKKVPNCVPTEEKEVEEGYVSDAQRKAVWAARNDAKKEETDVPFDPDPPKKNPSATPGKHGSGYSTARHLARMALQKQQQKQAQKAQNK
jgi:hypothetical protein